MRFALRRLGFFALTLWAALTLNFFLPRLMPGNPAEAMMGKFRGPVNPQALKALEAAFGVSTKEGLFGQYFHYLGDVATGNFGTSLYPYPQSVGRVILDAIPWTLGLVGRHHGPGLPARHRHRHPGRLAARRPAGQHRAAGLRDHLGDPVLLGRDDADPGVRRSSCSGSRARSATASHWRPASTWRSSCNIIEHAVLPACALLITTIGTWILTMRNTMVTTLAEDYVRMARAKGLPGRRIMLDYAARNAILPNLTGFAMSLGFVVGGAILVEYVFNYPGRRLHAAPGGEQRGLPADAGPVPADHRRGAGGHPAGRHSHRDP